LCHDFIQTECNPFMSFKNSTEALQDGVLELEWTCGEEKGAQDPRLWIINQGNLGRE